jgi:hypothetical protein
MGKVISYDDYLKLEGLKVLAKEHNKALSNIENAVLSITGESGSGGHSGDFVYDNDISVGELMKKLGITNTAPPK